MSESNYYEKYLKYKKKYLELKASQEAGDVLSTKEGVQDKLKKLFVKDKHYKLTVNNVDNKSLPNLELKVKYESSEQSGKGKHRKTVYNLSIVDVLNNDKVGGANGKYKNILEQLKDKKMSFKWSDGIVTSGNLVTNLYIVQPDGTNKENKFHVVTSSIKAM